MKTEIYVLLSCVDMYLSSILYMFKRKKDKYNKNMIFRANYKIRKTNLF